MTTSQQVSAFGKLLRQHRLAAGLTQASLAEQAGVSERAIQHLERGLGQPQRETTRRLVDVFALLGEERAQFETAAQPAPRRSTESGRTPRDRSVQTLPLETTSFIGREPEVAEVIRRLETSRLLTLVGLGGIGKTRLAIAAARRSATAYADGVIFVDLGAVRDARLVAATIAHRLDVRESGGRSALELLVAHLRERELLLVLDNFEHLLGATPVVSDLVHACPRLTVLVTSRSALRLGAEQRLRVLPMATPAEDEARTPSEAMAWPAVRLFVERAQAVAPGFALSPSNASLVAHICRRLDGLPLAIELAAARVPVLSPQALLRRLDHRLPVLIGGPSDAPQRHQTLRAALAWSYELLDPVDQVLFRRLAVFAGGGGLDAIEAVCADDRLPKHAVLDHLQRLVDCSLLRRVDPAEGGSADAAGEPRLSLLDTVREFGLELLEADGSADDLRARHAAYFIDFAGRVVAELKRNGCTDAIRRLGPDRDNVRGALDWLASQADLQPALRLAAAAAWLWSAEGQVAEGRKQLTALLQQAPAPTSARASALLGCAMLAWGQGDYQAEARLAQESLDIARTGDEPEITAEALSTLGAASFQRGEHAAARRLLLESLALFRTLGQRLGIGWTLMRLASVARDEGQFGEAELLYQEALALRRAIGDRTGVGHILSNLSWMALYTGAYARAEALQQESLAIRRAASDRREVAISLIVLARIALARGAHTAAWDWLREGLDLCRAFPDLWSIALGLEVLAGLLAPDQPTRALRLAGAADALRANIGRPVPAPERALLEGWLAPARTALGQTGSASWSAGASLTAEAALAEALSPA